MVKYIRDYYKILRIKKTANQQSIKKAYKRAAKKYHPDVNNKQNTEKKFKLIQEAYTVLSDKNKKAKYDKLYEEATNSKQNNNINLNKTIKIVKDLNDNYDIVSKGFNILSKSMKSQPLVTGSKILFGGVATGYGINKGRKYMKRKGK